MNLTELKPGEKAKVKAVNGGHNVHQRLASMGIYPGTEILVVRGGSGGPVIAKVRGSRIVLGRGMAHRVTVTPLSQ